MASGFLGVDVLIHEITYKVSTLPATGTFPVMRAFVNDSTATLAAGHGNVVVGGGGQTVPVYNDGANWRIG